MLPFLKPLDEPANYAIIGKLPNRPDFVRINAAHPVVSEFDELIQNAMVHLPDDAESARAYSATLTDFYYTSRDQKWVFMGSLMGSRDLAGRRFPLLAGVVMPVEQIAREAVLAPIAYEIYFEELHRQISNAMDNAVEAISCQAYLHTQCGAESCGVVDFELARDILERFSSQHTAARLTEVLASAEPPVLLSQALLNIAYYGDFMRRFENPATLQQIVLPLPPEHGEDALVAAEWLALLNGAWGHSAWRGSFFVRREAGRAWLAASYGRIPDRFLAWIVGGRLDPTAQLNLRTEEDAWRAHHYYAETAYSLGRLLTDPSASLMALRDVMIDIGRKLAWEPR